MFDWMKDDLERRRTERLYRTRRRADSAQGAIVRIDGRELVNFASNDYLGLASDPRLGEAARVCTERFGCGAGSSPLISGHLEPLRQLEVELADWQGTEAALVFSSGFAANLAVVSTLAGSGDALFSDQLNHASLIDGCRLSRAETHVYRHRDVGHLAELLDRVETRRRFIVTDSVFSMDGSVAPLGELLGLAEEFDAVLVVDEAHATGVLGETGRGATESLPLDARGRERLLKVGTLSKALGSQGGFVCGPGLVCDWLVNAARPYIFSTALAPTSAAAALAAVRIVRTEPERRARLRELADRTRAELKARGYDIGLSTCQIVPVIVGDSEEALALSARLDEAGLLVPAIRPPSVPVGTARLRVSLRADHTDAHLDALLEHLPERNAP